jgi:ribosomal protein S18 acetylase RimI-like enzyme
MDVTYQFSCENVATHQLEELFRATNLNGREGAKIHRAFANSSLVCFAWNGMALIGASRALTDGEYHAVIYDVVVHPAYQARGIGRHMMEQLLGRLSVWRVLLVADRGVQGFYSRLGFESYSDVMARLDWRRLHDGPPDHRNSPAKSDGSQRPT